MVQNRADDFGIDTDTMTSVANAIKSDTEHLTEQTKSLMGQLDDTYLNFPPGAANLAQESQISLNAVLKRVNTEDSRISMILSSIVKEIDKMEKEFMQSFLPPDQPKQKHGGH
ncbi:hypothetical protein KDH_50580 [Dictyobacter sp. S3.2.2.5]|uniref:Uncharacterized protein n=1 Tax=Dictyobacter halimunensis TaxID=3026934 RepID=A0ABQ6FVC9_9CHLR|nr:hypothetical protein KDH_50580 [Dictyobacter sp. S3.2.2.5]